MGVMNTNKWFEFVNGVSARVNEIIKDSEDYNPSFLNSGLWEVVNTADDFIYRTEGVTSLGYHELFDEGASIKEDETFPQYQTEYVMQQYGKIVSFTQMLSKTRSTMIEKKLNEVQENLESARKTLNKRAWQVLVDGFVATDSKPGLPVARLSDGVSMYSTAHPSKVPGVANRSNRVASNPVLSETNLFSATQIIEEQLDGRGLPIGYEGNYLLVVPPALRKLAQEITGSSLRSDTANNDVNFFAGGFMNFYVSTYLGASNGGSNTAWYVFATDVSGPRKTLKYVSLIDPKVDQETDFDTKTHRVSVDAANAFGYSTWEMTAASDGTGV